jgi:hypothetical protein
MRMIRLLGVAAICAFTLGPVGAEDSLAQNEEPKYTIEQLIADLSSENEDIKGLEILQDVIVDTPKGILTLNHDYATNRATMLIAPVKYCGVSPRTVLLKETQGTYETWWCKDNIHNVAADFYEYSGGGSVPTLTAQNKRIPCPTPGIPVRVYALACP